MFYTTPEVKNLEQVHSEPGNSKLQCTSGPALIPATTFMPHPGNIIISMCRCWRDFISTGAGTFWAWKFKITMHQWTGINSGHHIYAPPHPGNINVPALEGFYKHRHRCILRALGPGSILVVFYCPLLSHRWYTVCGVCSSVNNGTVGLLINPLQWFSVTTAVPMPLSPGSICDNIQPDPYPNPPFVKWCDLRFFGIFQQGREL